MHPLGKLLSRPHVTRKPGANQPLNQQAAPTLHKETSHQLKLLFAICQSKTRVL